MKDLKKLLSAVLSKAGKTSPSYDKRIANIEWISNLDRQGLEYRKKERQILIHKTRLDEKIFLQYPGKESAKYNKNGKPRKDTAIRPWDFRPRLYLSDNAEHLDDSSFFDIWATIFKVADELTKNNKKDVLRALAVSLYRMAFMQDHAEIGSFKSLERDVSPLLDKHLSISRDKEKTFPHFFKYAPKADVLDYLSSECPRFGVISLEAFLYYNDMLAWNEDCKYYYRNYHVTKTEKWISSTGRVNTLLTHIRILGFLLGDVDLSKILSDFSTQRGVSPASKHEISAICKGYIYKT